MAGTSELSGAILTQLGVNRWGAALLLFAIGCGDFDETSFAKIPEVLGNLHLRLVEDFLKMTDAERSGRKYVEDSQPRAITQALVNLN